MPSPKQKQKQKQKPFRYNPAIDHTRRRIDEGLAAHPEGARRIFLIAQNLGLNYPAFSQKDEYLRAIKILICVHYDSDATSTSEQCFAIIDGLTEAADVPLQLARELDRRVRKRGPNITGAMFGPVHPETGPPSATLIYPSNRAPKKKHDPKSGQEAVVSFFHQPDGSFFIGMTFSPEAFTREPSSRTPEAVKTLDDLAAHMKRTEKTAPSTIPRGFEPGQHLQFGQLLGAVAAVIRGPHVIHDSAA